MKIVKYIKKGNGNYQVLLDNNKKYNINEDIILKYNLLYKDNIDEYLLEEILEENNIYDIYNKCIKYISIRLRSINEIREYMKRYNIEESIIDKYINKLIDNNLLDDNIFTKAFINDKLNFSTMGPYKIELELYRHKIDKDIINKYIYNIDKDIIREKIDKLISKKIKSTKDKNKIYKYLLSLGYDNNIILEELNKYL